MFRISLAFCLSYSLFFSLILRLFLSVRLTLRYPIIHRVLGDFRREVEALQAENYALEKDMHSYQQSIASKCSSSINSQGPSLVGCELVCNR